MFCDLSLFLRILLALAVAFTVSFFLLPYVRRFAESVGAVDQPSARRINDHPVPRMGGISIFCGFIVACLLFVRLTTQVKGILVGCCVISLMGAIDDVVDLNPWLKLVGQIVAAMIAVSFGVISDTFTNFLEVGGFIYPGSTISRIITVLWIVGCTNAVNLIDGLDGLAVGMSSISAATLFVISLVVEGGDPNISVILVCLLGACIGFWPYNRNPAKIFMGDVGSQMLGYVLSTVSVIGLFKMHALVTMLIPVMSMAVPLADTSFAIVRRLLKGQSPFHADKGHLHHRLLALGLNQRQAVTVMYSISIVLSVFAFLMVGERRSVKIIFLVVAVLIVSGIILYVFRIYPHRLAKRSPKDIKDADVKIYDQSKRKMR